MCIFFLATLNPVSEEAESNRNWTCKQVAVEEIKWSQFGGERKAGEEPADRENPPRSSHLTSGLFFFALWKVHGEKK